MAGGTHDERSRNPMLQTSGLTATQWVAKAVAQLVDYKDNEVGQNDPRIGP